MLERRHADQLDERGIEYIGFAVDGAKRMQFLINDLLSFSRVDPIDILLVEDDPGDELITREAFEHNEEGLDYLYQRGKYQRRAGLI
ncbi:hypothetical protein NJB1604_36580 [Mycobacterium marinum]|nr:hypothetical protein NJB1604_36580 [Mycobacterium marinum]